MTNFEFAKRLDKLGSDEALAVFIGKLVFGIIIYLMRRWKAQVDYTDAYTTGAKSYTEASQFMEGFLDKAIEGK